MKTISVNPRDAKGMSKRYCHANGFTLLEILVAVSLLMVVIALAGMAMRMGLNAVRAGERKIETQERFRSSLHIIFSQIGSEIPLMVRSGEEKKIIFRGSKNTLLMPTGYSVWEGLRGYVVVEYHVIADQKGKVSLRAIENRIGSQKNMETILFSELDHISFEYPSQQDNPKKEEMWVDEWKDDEKLPEKIKMNLGYKGGKYSFIVPIRAKKTGN